MHNKIQGMGVALVTPFEKSLNVDYLSLEKIVKRLYNADFLVINGSTAEAMSLTDLELKKILNVVTTHYKGPIVLGIASSNTLNLVNFIKNFDFTSLSAVMLSSPYYNKPCQEGIYNHFITIADICPIPILLYNVPSRTGSNLEAQTTIKLSKHPNICGIKEASGNICQSIEISQQTQNFSLICGDDLLALPMIAIGAKGLISTIGNCYPIETQKMVNAALNSDFNQAKEFLFFLKKYLDFIKKYGNPAGTKAILASLQLCERYLRPPLYHVNEKIN